MGVIENAVAHGYDAKTKTWHSTRQEISLPEEEIDTVEWLHQVISSEKVGEKLAMVDAVTEEQFTYKQLQLRFQSVAAGLNALGIKQGDVVLLLSPNSVWFPVVVLGAMSAGAILTTVNPVNTIYEITNQLKDSGAKIIITTLPLYSKVAELGKPVILIGAEENYLPKNSISFSTLLAADPQKALRVQRRQSDTAALLYSSGTTGISKGVIISHKGLMAVAQQAQLGDIAVRERRLLVTLPMFHVYGLAVIVLAELLRASTLVILPKFEPELFLHTVEKYRVTELPIVPPIVLFLAKGREASNYDLSSVIQISSGASPLGKDLILELHQRFPAWNIRQGFGMTETTGLISLTLNKPDFSHFGSTGELVSSVHGRIVNLKTNENLPPYEQGEIWIKAPNNMLGYLKNEVATANCLDSDGWLHTGDLGYFDELGQLWVVDRLKELIKYKGYQVPPAELEAVLLTHPLIVDAAVVPFPDKDAGEVPIAYVVRQPKSNLTAKEVMTFISERVAPFKRLRRVTFIDTIPKSLSGKILRRELTQLGKANL